jgi:phosphatidylglycerol:prolipoprotein diacylglycerol transferase
MTLSPIAFEIGPLVVRWYALAYVVGILLAYRAIVWLDGRRATPLLTDKARDDLIFYGVLGVILGGRFGYVVFYNAPYYLDNPLEVLYIWQGGMAFHGGFVGVLAAFYLFARKYKIKWLQLMDLLAVATPIGLFLGRLANFVNGELYGRVTDAPWGVVFAHGGDLPRHPSQLYEAGLEGLVLGLLLWYLALRSKALHHPGILGGVFLMGYGLSRFLVEFFREPDAQLGFLTLGLTMGQWLCVPMVLVGGWLVWSAKKRPV